jgi:hypothetical protein
VPMDGAFDNRIVAVSQMPWWPRWDSRKITVNNNNSCGGAGWSTHSHPQEYPRQSQAISIG